MALLIERSWKLISMSCREERRSDRFADYVHNSRRHDSLRRRCPFEASPRFRKREFQPVKYGSLRHPRSRQCLEFAGLIAPLAVGAAGYPHSQPRPLCGLLRQGHFRPWLGDPVSWSGHYVSDADWRIVLFIALVRFQTESGLKVRHLKFD